MAKGGAEDVVLAIETVLFRTNQRKLQLASEAPGTLTWKLYLRGQNLKKKRNLHKEIVQLELLNTSTQRKDGRRKLCDFLVLPLIGSEKNRFFRPKQRPRHRPQP